MKLRVEVSLDPGHIVLDGDPAPRKKGTQPPNFRPMTIVAKQLDRSRCHLLLRYASAQGILYYIGTPPPNGPQQPPLFGPCVLWPLGTEEDLGPGRIVLDRDPALTKRGTPPLFGPCLLWLDSWMDQDATWYGGRTRPRPHRVSWGPTERDTAAPPSLFGPLCCGTVAHLSCC